MDRWNSFQIAVEQGRTYIGRVGPDGFRHYEKDATLYPTLRFAQTAARELRRTHPEYRFMVVDCIANTVRDQGGE